MMNKAEGSTKCLPIFDHVSDEILISAADGELDSGAAASVKFHLEACWYCRVRMEKIERAIEGLIDYRAAIVVPYSSPRDGSRAIFSARLNQCASEFVPQPDWRGLVGRLASFVGILAEPRIALAGALLAVSLAIFVARVAELPTVSANAVLERARISERACLATVQHPVVYQKLRIRSRQGVVTRTIYHDRVSGREADSSDASQGTVADLQRRMQQAKLDWQDPLSVSAFVAWHESLQEKTDEVSHGPQGMLVVRTNVPGGHLSEVDLTLRDSDYHAVAETLRFQDENIEMTEVDFSVLASESVNPAIFGPLPAQQPVAIPVRPPVSGPSLSELADAEVEARMALHMLRADLGEPIDVSSDGKEVLVSGLVETAERKEEVVHALQLIPYLHTSLTSATEATEKDDSPALKDDNPVVAVETASLMDSELRAAFPDPQDRTKFVNQILETTMNASGRAWSLRRLSDRYTNDISSRLDIQAERKVELLIRDDAGLLQEDLQNLRQLLLRLPPARQRDRSMASTEGEQAEPADWHWGVDSAFSESQRIQNDISTLFSGLDTRNTDADAILADLLLAVRRMDQRLPVLCHEVSGGFLTAADRHLENPEPGERR
jgi:hypothetical protein